MNVIAANNCLFHGKDCRIPTTNVTALERHTYQHIGEMIVSLVHGGPAPTFFAPCVVDYIVHGIKKVNVDVNKVPFGNIKGKLEKVS